MASRSNTKKPVTPKKVAAPAKPGREKWKKKAEEDRELHRVMSRVENVGFKADEILASIQGRPTTYTEAMGEKICDLLMEGLSLNSICRLEGMPAKSTVLKWAHNPDRFREEDRPALRAFGNQYRIARDLQVEGEIDNLQDIADDARNDYMEIMDHNGECVGYRENGEFINRSKLRTHVRQWYAMKMKPKKYGEPGAAKEGAGDRLDELVAAMSVGPVPRGVTHDE